MNTEEIAKFKENEIKRFKDNKVWITKKSRMNAEQRVNRNDLNTQIIINYYTFWVLAASIWSLKEDNININILTVIMSVGLFGISIFINSMNYKEKALKYKDSYHRLSHLESQLQQLLESDRSLNGLKEKLQQYRNSYNNILELTDNHSCIDYEKVLITNGSNGSNNYTIMYNIIKNNVYIVLINIILFILPILVIIILFWR